MFKKERNIALAIIFLILIITPIFDRAPYHIFVLNMVAINIILVMALNFILGFAGQVFLGTVGFYAIACYSTSLLTVNYGLSFWQAVPFTIIVTSILSLILGLPTLKLKGFYLALMSSGFIYIVLDILRNWKSFTGGVWGIMGIPRPFIGTTLVRSDLHFYFIAITITLCLAIFAVLIEDSKFGRAFRQFDDQLSSDVRIPYDKSVSFCNVRYLYWICWQSLCKFTGICQSGDVYL